MVSVEAFVFGRTTLIVPGRIFDHQRRSGRNVRVIQRRTRSVSGTVKCPASAQTHAAKRGRIERAPATVRLLVTGGTLTELGTRTRARRTGRPLQNGPAHAPDTLDRLVAGSNALVESGRPTTFVPPAFSTG